MQKDYVMKDGKFYARVTYTDSLGKRRQIWRQAENKTDARNKADEIRRQLQTGSQSFEYRGTLDSYLDKWLESKAHKISSRTLEDYKGLLRLHIRPALGTKKLSAIRPLQIQEMVNALIAKGLSPRTVRYTHAVLSRSLNQAVKWGLITKNPAPLVELPKQTRKEMRVLDQDQAKRFLAQASQDRFSLAFHLAVITGMRPEEYLALQWPDIDLQKNTLTVQRTLVWERWTNKWYFGEPKTARSRRTIPIPAGLTKSLATLKAQQGERRLQLGEQYQNNNLVFASKVGTPVSIRNFERRHFKPILKQADLPDIRLYDLRHTCATLLLLAGENPKVVSERLGHASIVLTLDTYSHVLPNMQKDATDKLEALLR